MEIKNILFVSPRYKEIYAIIKNNAIYQIKEFRFCSEKEVTKEDFLWADAFVSFKRTENFTIENIKWVHSLGAGVDKILRNTNWNEEVPLTRTICSFGQKISEYCLSYILRDIQQHDQYEKLNNKKEWNPIPPIPLGEKKVIVYGTGVIGQEVARSLSFFGGKVYGVSQSGKPKEHFTEVVSSDSNYHHLLKEVDYVINTMPLTKETDKIFNDFIFSSLLNAIFINVGRGESVDNDSLIEALSSGNVKLAILDVFQEEPLTKDSPFWEHPKVIVTPHISAITTPEEGVECFLETLQNIEEDKPLSNLVDLRKGF